MPLRSRSHRIRVACLYAKAVLGEFKGTLLITAAAVALGTFLYTITPHAALGGRKPDLLLSAFGAWTALFGQVLINPPETWYLELLHGLYPILGFVVLGEGVVRFALLMTSRRRGEKEWTMVTASTYRDHVVLCGLGHLGVRVMEELLRAGIEVVAIDRDENGDASHVLRERGVPLLVRDMRDEKALEEAGIRHARAIIAATNDEMVNLEVALDARRLNPKVRVLIRFHDAQIAAKIQGAFDIDEAFSAEALAAPVILSKVLASPRPAST